jgi:hypothetical protein
MPCRASDSAFPELRSLGAAGAGATKVIAVAQHCPKDLQPKEGGSWDIKDFMLLHKLHAGEPAGLGRSRSRPPLAAPRADAQLGQRRGR